MGPAGLKIVFALLVVIVTEGLVNIVDPFGVDEAIKERSASVLQKVTAPFYGAGDDTAGQQVVTVVLIDRRFLQALHPSAGNDQLVWPLPVKTLAGVLRRIVDAKPTAVFVDIAFPNAPREITENGSNSRSDAQTVLGQELLKLDPDVPVFISDVIAPTAHQQILNGSCRKPYLPENDLRSASVLAPGLGTALFDGQKQGHIRLVDSAAVDGNAGYLLAPISTGPRDGCEIQEKASDGFIASPALALFKAFAARCPEGRAGQICRRSEIQELGESIKPSSQSDTTGFVRYHLEGKAMEPLSPRWGVRLSQAMRDTFVHENGSDRCSNQFYGSQWESVSTYLLQLVGPIAKRLGIVYERRCAYIDTISPIDLVDPRRFNSRADPRRADAMADRFIKDRIVLIGADVPQAQDRFVSPVNGDVPGVYVHATAVENLITSGNRFRLAEPPGWEKGLFFLCVIALIAFMRWVWEMMCRLLSPRFAPFGEFVLAPLAYGAAMLIVGSLLIIALTLWTDFPLIEIAVPLIALHAILLSGYLRRVEEAFERHRGDGSDINHRA